MTNPGGERCSPLAGDVAFQNPTGKTTEPVRVPFGVVCQKRVKTLLPWPLLARAKEAVYLPPQANEDTPWETFISLPRPYCQKVLIAWPEKKLLLSANWSTLDGPR